MKAVFALSLFLCSMLSFAQQSIDTAFSFQSESNKMLSLYIPSSYDSTTANAMMIGFHPYNVNVWDSESWRDTLIVFAETNGLIMMCPDGGANGIVDDQIDTAFTSAMCDSMLNWYNIDTNKIYAMGFSVGGRATYTYSLSRPEKIAGFIPIGAAITGTTQVNSALQANASCKPIYIVHGGSDTPNTRYWPARNALVNANAWVNSNLMSGVGHTINFANRNAILSAAYQWVDSLNCLPLTVGLGGQDTICSGDSLDLGTNSMFGGSCPYSYSWSPNYAISSVNDPSPKVSPATDTTYYLTVTDNEGNTSVDSIFILVNQTPELQISGDTAICNGDSAYLQVVGADEYTWMPSISLDCPICPNVYAYPSETTIYLLTGTSNNGCEAITDYTLTVNPNPSGILVPNNPSVCIGDDVVLNLSTSSNIFSVEWNDTTGLSCVCASPTLTIEDDRMLTIFFSNEFGCTSAASTTITALPLPQVNLMDSTLLCIDDTSAVYAEPNTTGSTYLWSNGDVTLGSWLSSSSSQYEYFTATSDDGCSKTDSIWLEIFEFNGNIVRAFEDFENDTCSFTYRINTDDLPLNINSYSWFVNGVLTGSDSILVGEFVNIIPASEVEVVLAVDNGCDLSYFYTSPQDTCFAAGIFEYDIPTFSLYPNPVRETLNVVFETKGQNVIHISSTTGEVLKSMEVSMPTAELDLSNLSPGMYFIHVSNDEGRQARMFVKE